MSKKELAKKISQVCRLKGDFLLRSGMRSSEYFDKYNLESDPQLLASTVEHLLPFIPKETEVLAGLEMGGIPIATALSLKMNKPLCFVRKKAKPYGTMKICEGAKVQNKNLCLIEDVISTGGQVIESAKELQSLGAKVTNVVCVIFRGKKKDILNKTQFKLSYLFTKEDLNQF